MHSQSEGWRAGGLGLCYLLCWGCAPGLWMKGGRRGQAVCHNPHNVGAAHGAVQLFVSAAIK